MALFKISKGSVANLPSTYNEGYCYFTTDDGRFYIDIASGSASTAFDGTKRKALNAEKAYGDWNGDPIHTTYATLSSLGNGTLTIKQNGTTKTTFTANSTTDTSADIIVPDTYVQDSAPSDPKDGDIWVDTSQDSLNKYEVAANKVTSISASSTDTEYPSAKLLYTLMGDIEDRLEALL